MLVALQHADKYSPKRWIDERSVNKKRLSEDHLEWYSSGHLSALQAYITKKKIIINAYIIKLYQMSFYTSEMLEGILTSYSGVTFLHGVHHLAVKYTTTNFSPACINSFLKSP